jgi:fructose-specific phosphotransferase system component IIB
MLQGDVNLKDKITADDINNSNFIILNMGEKASGGYSISVDSVVETPEKIIVTVKENEPPAGSINSMAMTYPYCIVKINSKKPIEIK